MSNLFYNQIIIFSKSLNESHLDKIKNSDKDIYETFFNTQNLIDTFAEDIVEDIIDIPYVQVIFDKKVNLSKVHILLDELPFYVSVSNYYEVFTKGEHILLVLLDS